MVDCVYHLGILGISWREINVLSVWMPISLYYLVKQNAI